jgi:hypothetical protein
MARFKLPKFKDLRTQAGSASQWLWIAGAGVIAFGMLFMSFSTIEPGQVAVRVNNITGHHDRGDAAGLGVSDAVRHSLAACARRQPADLSDEGRERRR